VKILIAEDDAISRRLLERTLVRLGHEVIAVGDGSEAVQMLLAPDAPRLAILDWMMPGADGLAVCREVREKAESYIYVILLSAKDRHEDMITGLDAGADDFLTKPLNAVELRARLHSGARVIDLQERLLAAQEALRIEATHDHLTGLVNRRMIMHHLTRELNRARHEGRSVVVALADLDHFKAVNDTHGHAAGDAVLFETASRMRAAVRAYDFVGRYGGEEFLLVLPGADAMTGQSIAERVRARVAEEPVHGGLTTPLCVSVSVGVAWTGTAGLEPNALVAAADAALYRAKANGRNRVESDAADASVVKQGT